MPDIIQKGIVIKGKDYGESDKLITVLFKDIGKLNVYAKGSRKSASRLLAGTQLFSYSEFGIMQNKGSNVVTFVNVIKAFSPNFKDLETLYSAAFFARIADRVVLENVPSNNIMLLVLKGLKALSVKNAIPQTIILAFMLRIMAESGVAPSTDTCVVCGNPASPEIMSAMLGGAVCNECSLSENNVYFPNNGLNETKPGDIFKLSKGAQDAIKFILNADASNIFKFGLSDSLTKELKKIIFSFFEHHMDSKDELLSVTNTVF